MRTEKLFNDNWEFVKLEYGAGLDKALSIGRQGGCASNSHTDDGCGNVSDLTGNQAGCCEDTVCCEEPLCWQLVTLPHDWLIYDTNDLYGDGTGWYRKSFTLDKENGKRYLINFDGVYMDSVVYVNGEKAGYNHYGYSAFELDITGLLVNGENTIMAAVNHKSPNSRWYSGAGIFRDVKFKCVPDVHIATDGVYISSKKENGRWFVYADVEVCGCESAVGAKDTNTEENTTDASKYEVQFDIRLLPALPENSRCIVKPYPGTEDHVIEDASQGDNCAVCLHPCAKRNEVKVSDVEIKQTDLTDSAKYIGASIEFAARFAIDDPFIWDITSPNLYELTTKLVRRVDDSFETIDETITRFGLREAVFTNDKGFFLNGRRVKLQGVCEHHDLGCLGAAFHKDAFRRKIMKLKEMGVNAIRTSHNMPAKGLVELADEMGILIDSEAFDMWRRPKTEFDYARFFNEDYVKDVASWVRRDRSDPSVIMWSTGNEIYDCHADESAQDLVRDLIHNVEMHDYRRNGLTTFGSNYMAWEGAQKCADILKLAGYNYGERLYDAHHKKYPDWMIYGSETCSTVQSRGIYHFPMKVSVMADDDEQCSALGNCTTSWGAENVEYVIKAERDHEFSSGQFLWSGFDYIGEPTPYHTKNSYFGQIDTAGFEKDTYYIFKSCWTDLKKEPFIHVFPYWDFNEGQIIDVRIASNAPYMKLIVNGVSHGKKYVDHSKDAILCPTWQVPYHKGYIEGIAYDENGNEIARQRRSSFGDVKEVKYRKFVTLDERGDEIKDKDEIRNNAQNIGTENKVENSGIEKKKEKRLAFFEIYAVDSDGNEVENANCRVNVKVVNGTLLGLDNGDSTDFDQYKCDSRRLFVGRLLAVAEPMEGCSVRDVELELTIDENDIPIRKIEICCAGGADTPVISGEEGNTAHFYPGHISERIEAHIHPSNATYSDITWVAVNDYAVRSNLAVIEADDNTGTAVRSAIVTAKGDGEFRLRCMTHNGTEKMQCISSLEFAAAGLGTAYHDPYDFIAGSLYTDHKGDVGNGNEKGVATPRGAEGYVGYENIDFGDFGSDEITIPIFTLDGNEYKIGIWEGRPGDEGSRLLLDARYCKPSIWNVYQPETYKLNRRVKGVTSIYFTTEAKIHIKGFSFTKPDKAFARVFATDNTRVYGDTFTVASDAVTGIGNNVTLEFDDMAFGGRNAGKVAICGISHAENNSIHLKLTYADGKTEKTLLEFKHTDEYEEKIFDLSSVDTTDCVKVEFVFLPGSNFDFKYFEFRE
ncbi:MAG: DUF4982 domain-containing protein [Lachnospiraceae bacterium]|nr:DUF4982 domain-containing protein [Lachnospiraceae bacterium]